MKKKVVIIGASGHGKVIADIVNKSGDELVGFLDDDKKLKNKIIFDNKTVLGSTDAKFINHYKNCHFIIGVGNNGLREQISKKYEYINWYTAIHPNSIIGNDVKIKKGSVVMAGAVINSGTKIGKHSIINTCSSLDHDNLIGDFVHISPGAHLAGNVKIGDKTRICTGAIIINNISIGKNNIIGAGATVLNNIDESDGTYVGIPAHKINNHK